MKRSLTLFALMGAATLLSLTANAQETIDFEGLTTGEIVSSVMTDAGSGPFGVLGTNPNFAPGVNAAIIFDSSNPTGDDPDLGSPNENFGGPGIGVGGEGGAFANTEALGKILIVAENLDDSGGDGFVDDPDDLGGPDALDAMLEIDFSSSGTVTVTSMTIIDVETDELNAVAELFDPADNLIAAFVLPQVGDNGVATVGLGPTPGVERLKVTLNGSGGIDNIVLGPEEEDEGEGCTPGYWKNHTDRWIGFAPGDLFDSVFGVSFDANLTLIEALNLGGGKENRLARHGTAALLNAAHPDVGYGLTSAQVISLVQDGMSGDANAAADILEDFNEEECPLGGTPANPGPKQEGPQRIRNVLRSGSR